MVSKLTCHFHPPLPASFHFLATTLVQSAWCKVQSASLVAVNQDLDNRAVHSELGRLSV